MAPSTLNLAEPDDLLLLYAAGELTPDERSVADRRLAGDAALRERLAAVEATLDRCEAAFAGADAATPLSSSDVGRVAARASSAVWAWQEGRQPRNADLAKARRPSSRPRVPWAAPTAAAAAVILLLAGTMVIRNWPSGETTRTASNERGNEEEGGGPPPWMSPEREEWGFRVAALRTLAVGSDVLDADLETSPTTTQADPGATAEPTVASAEPLSPGDGPVFDVPLSPEADGTH